ncbi:hypothetical protein EV122DRAFT_219717 [Schizophyllum commune]
MPNQSAMNPTASPSRQMPPPALSPRQLATLALGTPRSGRTAAEISTDDRAFTRFRAPAHKHAHHLHSIPPREKSTRTLILDHILWVHALTRLAQARAELGMSDLCPPPPESSSPGPYNPLRPESYAHAAQESDGEEDSLITLRSRVGNPGDPHLDTEDQRLYEKQDLDLARGLRTRAEALEKVIVATLDGMPRVNPHENAEGDSLDGLGRPPESSESGKNEVAAGLSTSKAPSASSKDTKQTVKPAPPLPNGVRLRLALGTVINDLFARCPPPPPRRRRGSLPSGDGSDGPSQEGAQEAPVVEEHTTRDEWPTPLRSLAKAAHIDDGMPPQEDPALTSIPDANRTRALYVPGADPATANSPAEMRCPRHLHNGCGICVIADEATSAKGKSHVSGYRVDSRGRFFGANRQVQASPMARTVSGRSTQGSSPGATRSPAERHSTIPSSSDTQTSPSAFRTPVNAFSGISQGNGLTGYLDGAGIGTGLAGAGSTGKRSVVRRGDGPSKKATTTTSTTEPGGHRPSSRGSAEREREEDEARRRAATATTSLASLIPRFLRLSALVAKELGREAKEGKDVEVEHGPGHTPGENDTEGAGEDGAPRESGPGQAAVSSGASAASSTSSTAPYIPTAHWYLLLAGLLTRAALEGYLSTGWTGRAGVRVLLGLGVGGPGSVPAGRTHRRRPRRRSSGAKSTSPEVVPPRHSLRSPAPSAAAAEQANGSVVSQSELESSDEEDDEFAPYDPDELPSLEEAVRLLFPTLARRLGVGGSRSAASGTAEEAYIIEMEERMRRFYTIPPSTPDLSTHMEDLAWQYPAEPVERAAVRFCESVCRWRGKPEIESYRKPATAGSSNNNNSSASNGTDSSPLMPMNALVHSNPTSPVVGVGTSLPSTTGFPAVGVPYQWGISQANQAQGPQPSEASAADEDEMVMPQKNAQPSVETYFAPAFSTIVNTDADRQQQQQPQQTQQAQQQPQNPQGLGLSYSQPYPGMYNSMNGSQPSTSSYSAQPGYSSYAQTYQSLMPPPPPPFQPGQQAQYGQQSYASSSTGFANYGWGNMFPAQMAAQGAQQSGEKRQRTPGAEQSSPGRGEKRVRF